MTTENPEKPGKPEKTEKPGKPGKPEKIEKTEKTEKPEKVVKKKRKLTNISEGIAHIQSTFNNTIISITDMTGNVIASASAGTAGYKGSRKGTPYAAQLAAQKAAEKVMALGMQKIRIYVNGPGPGRESAIRSLQAIGIKIILIRDVTPIPHNGCRPPKRRRV